MDVKTAIAIILFYLCNIGVIGYFGYEMADIEGMIIGVLIGHCLSQLTFKKIMGG